VGQGIYIYIYICICVYNIIQFSFYAIDRSKCDIFPQLKTTTCPIKATNPPRHKNEVLNEGTTAFLWRGGLVALIGQVVVLSWGKISHLDLSIA
jgi:hypothetical protein